jgi:hypothetical protein
LFQTAGWFDKGNVVSALHPRQTTKECSIQRFFVLGMQEIWCIKTLTVECTGVSYKMERLLAIECFDNPRQEFLLTGGLEINSCLSHVNVVSLIGYCVKNMQLILVYDFLHQRTLWDHLYGTRTRHRNPSLVEEPSKS